MNKLEFISKQLSRAQKKPFEHYVITRIWHLLNDLSLKFITQQYISRPIGRALTDMYFPQLGIHIEINEPHHLNQEEQDKLRQIDIINATNHRILTVHTIYKEPLTGEKKYLEIDEIHHQINNVVEIISCEKNKILEFEPWDLHKEQNSQTYIDKGFISLSDNVVFRTSLDAINCFGYTHKNFQKGGINHLYRTNTFIWFPKLYKSYKRGWDNKLSDDELTLIEKTISPTDLSRHVDRIMNSKVYNRIIFVQSKSPLGDIMYRFKGEYVLDTSETNSKVGLVWKRISDKVETYKPRIKPI